MSTVIIPEDFQVNGSLKVVGAINFVAGVDNADVASSAGILATKLQHQHIIPYSQADGSAVAAAIVPIYTCRGATGTVVAFQVACVDSPSGGGDLKFTVDLKIFDADTPAPASILTGVVDYVNDTADGVVLAGTIDSASLVVGDSLMVVVAVSGSTGTQGQGLIVSTTVREDAE